MWRGQVQIQKPGDQSFPPGLAGAPLTALQIIAPPHFLSLDYRIFGGKKNM